MKSSLSLFHRGETDLTGEPRTFKEKHGIDFEAATQLWNDKDRIEIQTSFPGEK